MKSCRRAAPTGAAGGRFSTLPNRPGASDFGSSLPTIIRNPLAGLPYTVPSLYPGAPGYTAPDTQAPERGFQRLTFSSSTKSSAGAVGASAARGALSSNKSPFEAQLDEHHRYARCMGSGLN